MKAHWTRVASLVSTGYYANSCGMSYRSVLAGVFFFLAKLNMYESMNTYHIKIKLFLRVFWLENFGINRMIAIEILLDKGAFGIF